MFQAPVLNSSTASRGVHHASMSSHDGDDEEEDGNYEYDDEEQEASYEHEDDEEEEEEADEDEDLGDVDDVEVEQEYELSSDAEDPQLQSDEEMRGSSDVEDESGKENEGKAKVRYRIIEPPEFIVQTSSQLEEAYRVLEPEDDTREFDDLFDGSVTGRRPLSQTQKEAHLQKVSHIFLSSLKSYAAGAQNQRLDEAAYHAKLLLPLYYPPPLDISDIDLHSNSHLLRHLPPSRPRPMVLLEWLNEHHPNPDPRYLMPVMDYKPNPGVHEDFWYCVQTLALRCRLQECRYLLAAAQWKSPGGVVKDSKTYPPEAAVAVQQGCNLLQNIILECPIVALMSNQEEERVFARPTPNLPRDEKWETGSLPWRVWRSKIDRAIEELESMSHRDPSKPQKQPEVSGNQYFRSKKTATNPGLIPFTISTEIKKVFEILRGDMQYIMGTADSWFDAVGALVAYHNDGDSSAEGMDIDDEDSYDPMTGHGGTYREDPLRRIAKLFITVTKTEFPLPAMETTETVLGDILAGRLAPALIWMRNHSLLVASASAELLGWGGHLDNSVGREKKTLSAYNVDTLNNLDMDSDAPGVKETTVTAYAKALIPKRVLQEGSAEQLEGWEVAVLALKRLNTAYTNAEASSLVKTIPLDSTNPDRTDRLLDVCSNLGFEAEEKVISSNFGSILKEDNKIGLALRYFSRAQDRVELHTILSQYIKDSLIKGYMVPNSDALDRDFLDILDSPEQLRDDDVLRREISGFAALKDFFEKKQTAEDLLARPDQSTQVTALLSKAGATLVTLMRSAGEAVDCGVLNEDTESVIDVLCLGGLLIELLSAGGLYRYLNTDDLFNVLRVFEALFLVGGPTLEDVIDFYGEVADYGGLSRERFADVDFLEALGFLRVSLAQQIGSGWLTEETIMRTAKESLARGGN